MWIQGRRRGGSKDLSKHLQKEENESVEVREIKGFSFSNLTGKSLEKALKQMEAIGYGKGSKRNLYHAIVAPAYGCALNAAQRKFMVDYYAEHMGFQGHQCAVVEHWKKGKQHFHLVFNIINPITGKIHELKWTKRQEWKISRGLEEIFWHPTPTPKGKSTRTWEMQRGKRTDVDPRRMRKEVTAIFDTSKTAQEFVAALSKAGYALTRGNKNKLVLVDKVGDTHGLMRRIEGKKLSDLRQKFTGIEKLQLPIYADLFKERNGGKTETDFAPREFIDPQRVKKDVQNAYRTSKTGAEFFARLNKREYALGRGLKGFAVIDKNGNRHDIDRLLGNKSAKGLNQKFPDLAAIRPRPVSEIIRRLKAKKRGGKFVRRGSGGGSIRPSFIQHPQTPFYRQTKTAFAKEARSILTSRQQENPNPPSKLLPTKKGWPEAAMRDWKAWGHKDPPRFFSIWPELKQDGVVFSDRPTHK
ncbi:MAG: relaxase/mobilization nuclease domain-containing protein [Alphaproteobacteria bacterium]|nr:relaxase/mobilization nuclease domain-containing protein [Alphaproteobacteria bacterium]